MSGWIVRCVFGVVLVAAATVFALPSREVAQDPDDEGAERMIAGKAAFENACLMCHGSAIVDGQRFSADQWAASVKKMVGLGARVTPEELSPLLTYLARSERANPRTMDPRRVAKLAWDGVVVAPPRPEQAARGAEVYRQSCQNCHGADARGGEPGNNLVEHAVLLDPDAFALVVRDGRHRMPAFGQVLTAAQVQDVLGWLRTLQYDPTAVP